MNWSNISREFLYLLKEALEGVEQTGEITGNYAEIFLIGNGGSAAVAMHICNDINNKGWAALVPDYATITAFANDWGWDKALKIWVERHLGLDSMLIAISSSGKSENIIKAVEIAKKGKTPALTLTGFSPDNPLRKLGDLNYYVPSHNYGIVECAHLAILHSIVNPGKL